MSRKDTADVWEERFPPLFEPLRLREHEDAFAVAMARAAECGAGTVFHVGRFDPIEFAVVLEPEMPLAAARRALFVGMNALAATILADCPPERSVEFAYPDGVLFDSGLIGGGRIGWPQGVAEDAVPDWLVFGAMIRTGSFQELGFVLDPSATSLEEAGYRDVDPRAFAARFCRHLMVELDEWQEEGFKDIGRRYLDRLPKDAGEGLRGIDRNGDLVVHPGGGKASERRAFLPALAASSWYDPVAGAPRA